MNNKFNNALNEIDEALIEEAAYADRAERGGLRIARNIGLSVCGAAAVAALTFGIGRHLISLPENVDLLPADSKEASSDISDAIMEGALKTISVPSISVEDADPARLSAYAPRFIEAGNEWKSFDDNGNMLSESNTILVADCGGYWLEYDITDDKGIVYALLDIRKALEKAEDVLGAKLLPNEYGVTMDYYNISEFNFFWTVCARFEDGSCLSYGLKCDSSHENWTLTLLSTDADYFGDFESCSTFFREDKADVYDSARFSNGDGAYICDNSGEIRIVKHTSDGLLCGYLPFGKGENIFTLQNTENGDIVQYCVKENGDAVMTDAGFINMIGGAGRQDDPADPVLPAGYVIADRGLGKALPAPAEGASKVYRLSYAPEYNGSELQFIFDQNGKLFLYDSVWLYPCTIEQLDDNYCEIGINFYPEGREMPDVTYMSGRGIRILITDDIWTLTHDATLCLDVDGAEKYVTLPEGTEFSANGEFSEHGSSDTDITDRGNDDAPLVEEIRAAQAENAGQTVYSKDGFIIPVDTVNCRITVYYGYDRWRGGNYNGICFGHKDIHGAEIYAAQSGTVIIADNDEQYGKYAVIDHGDGISTLYAHCDDIAVTVGQSVTQGDVIGHIGATGSASGDCLHFEVRENGIPHDPIDYLPEALTISLDNEQRDQDLNNIRWGIELDNLTDEQREQELNKHWAELIEGIPDPSFKSPVGEELNVIEHIAGHLSESGYYLHSGIDIAAPFGTAIYAAADGEVILSQYYYGYGNCVVIRHNDGVVTLYAHCSELYAEKGELVTRGQEIAASGASGQTTGGHLHFEVRINDEVVDPELFDYE